MHPVGDSHNIRAKHPETTATRDSANMRSRNSREVGTRPLVVVTSVLMTVSPSSASSLAAEEPGAAGTSGVAHGVVWIDADGDGIRGETEEGLSGVTMILRSNTSGAVGTSPSDDDGAYLLADAPIGDYWVETAIPEGFEVSPVPESDEDVVNAFSAVSDLAQTDNFYLDAGTDIALDLGETGASGANLANYTTSWVCLDQTDGGAILTEGTGVSGAFTMPDSIDGVGAAIVCTFDNEPLPLDLGDALDTYGTTLASNGPRHGVPGYDPDNDTAPSATVQETIEATGNTAWQICTGEYVVPDGQFITRFEFEAVASATGNPAAGNFLDANQFGVECPTDFGDAPASYGTLLVDDGAAIG